MPIPQLTPVENGIVSVPVDLKRHMPSMPKTVQIAAKEKAPAQIAPQEIPGR
jgi:hypothetical protein